MDFGATLRFVSAINELRRDFNPYIAGRGNVQLVPFATML